MSLGRAWVVRDLGERTKAAREVRQAGRPARTTRHAVAHAMSAGAHAVTTSISHAAHRVAKLTVVTHKSHIPAGRWHH